MRAQSLISSPPGSPADEVAELERLFAVQQAAMAREPVPDLAARQASLDAIIKLLRKHRKAFADVICADFRHRSAAETDLAEIAASISGAQHTKRHLSRWMKPQRRAVHWTFQPGSAKILYQPLGQIGIIVPWNYPLFLAFGPLIDAIAAGNRVIIKPSELAPQTAAFLKTALAEIFPQEQVAVALGGVNVSQHLCTLPFDHILFTGSTNVGRHVMRAAAENLTPVTLELGGKSPAVICRDYPLRKAARMVAFGKFINAGQTCVAPDYCLVPNDMVDAFTDALMEETKGMYPTIAGNEDYTSIISDRHYARLTGMIEEARSGGAKVVSRDEPAAAGERKIPPTFVIAPKDDTAVMREEIFGPILPILPYTDLDQAIAGINAGAKPLALYCFSHDHAVIDGILNRTNSGGVTVNGSVMHVLQHDLPFGGVGPSGQGAYHGRDGFIRMSHARSVFELGRLSMLDRLAAPYGFLFRFMTNFLIGK